MSNSKARILIIEDDEDLSQLLALKLRSNTYDIVTLFDFVGIEDLLSKESFDLVLIDRNLPSGDSLEKLKILRKKGFIEPVIFLTAKTLHEDLLDGFEGGCDDYICKPFKFNELLVRIKALLKRSQRVFDKLNFKNFILDLENRNLFHDDREIKLSNLEFELLKCFFENQNTLLSRQFLSENVWQNDLTSDKSINIALSRLKNKLPQIKTHILSIRGVGYKLC
ncbi:DNA-binding response regulator [Campylobacter sp. MIT 99-7217]|uniref:response regulator transcription factor n=1 Tax=Campylobacter sp. MIT 99-7217 TaxID=535091 RepID=UPI0011594C7C|nr:response regulator transcription factor [Campylobacter sp. MIT 99-7217]TQR34601.1 DNA-binding response regulator [Campylobacter sp. MIT 99-7217]